MKIPMIDRPKERIRFGLRLVAIRDASRRRRAAHAARRSEAALLKSARMVCGLEYLEKVERTIRAVLAALGGELPCPPVLSRGFFDGRYRLSARLDEAFSDGSGHKVSCFTRLSFLLEPRSDERRFVIEARSTVRERDLAAERLEVDMTSAGLDEIKSFVEGRALAFAEAYFADTELSRWPDEPCAPGPAVAV